MGFTCFINFKILTFRKDFIVIITIKQQSFRLNTVKVKGYSYYIVPTCFFGLPYIAIVIKVSSIETFIDSFAITASCFYCSCSSGSCCLRIAFEYYLP